MNVKLRFVPQAWVNDYAIEVDAEGTTEWDIPRDAMPDVLPDDNSYESDALREHPNAPAWVREWAGPFYVYITNREDFS